VPHESTFYQIAYLFIAFLGEVKEKIDTVFGIRQVIGRCI